MGTQIILHTSRMCKQKTCLIHLHRYSPPSFKQSGKKKGNIHMDQTQARQNYSQICPNWHPLSREENYASREKMFCPWCVLLFAFEHLCHAGFFFSFPLAPLSRFSSSLSFFPIHNGLQWCLDFHHESCLSIDWNTWESYNGSTVLSNYITLLLCLYLFFLIYIFYIIFFSLNMQTRTHKIKAQAKK